MDRRQLPGWISALNQAAPSIISAMALAAGALLFNMNQNIIRMDGHMRSFSDALNRITLRVDQVENDVQSNELEMRELKTIINLRR